MFEVLFILVFLFSGKQKFNKEKGILNKYPKQYAKKSEDLRHVYILN